MKKPIKFSFALICGKITIKLLKLLKRNATNLPGSVVLAICPDFLKYLEKPEKIIAITGTNGKTTVSNMILDILTDNGYDCTNNNFGGNVDTGITTALLKDSTLSGKAKKKYCVLEVDERSALRIYPYIKPDILVCTNLTRDSYKRNAHVEYIFNILNKYIPDSSHLVLNCDDIISSRLKLQNKRTYFGIAKIPGERLIPDNIIKDINICPICNAHLKYDFIRYNHIGRATCSRCDFKFPKADFDVIERTFTDDGKAHITVANEGNEYKYLIPCENTINVYNATATITALRTFGLTYEQIEASFKKISIVKSRFEIIEINNKKIISLLAKGQNPVACSHACNIVRDNPSEKNVIMLFDDMFDAKYATENTAWIYDVDFEFLNCDSVKRIIIGGERAGDYTLRLLIAGIPQEKIFCCEHEEDVAELIDANCETTYVVFDIYNEHLRRITENNLKEKFKNAC